jgi:hypothetical protein
MLWDWITIQMTLAHAGLARDEAVQRVDNEKQVLEQAIQRVRQELDAERDCRRSVEQERDSAIAARQEAEERLREVLAAMDAWKLSPASSVPTNDPAGGGDKVKQTRRRGRPAKSDQSEAEIVEWWKPGWRDRLR